MATHDDVCVLVPTYDEAGTIGDVVAGFRERGFENVLVVDGDSSDGTRSIAEDCGARVVVQSGSGKGQAVREALRTHVDAPYVLMLDGDGTYRPSEADRLLEPLLSGDAEHVIGNRFANMQPDAMRGLNRFGNRVINRSFRFIHGRDLVDILSGYRAFTTDSIRRFELTSDGFGIETELAVECVKHDVATTVVPITYEPRPDDSETNLRPFRDGGRIIVTLYQMAKTNNPLFYFGSVGSASIVMGLLVGAFVAYDWFVKSISHEVLAVVSGFGILFGIQLIMFGVLSDLIVTLNREQTRQFTRLAEELGAEPPVRTSEAPDATGEPDDGSGPPTDGTDRSGAAVADPSVAERDDGPRHDG